MNDRLKISERLKAMEYTLGEQVILKNEQEVFRFREIQAYDAGRYSGVIADGYWITPALLALPEQQRPHFHEIWYNEDLNLLVAELGAGTYILDSRTGFPISEGYHTITRGTNGLFGELGARQSMVELMKPEEGLRNFHNRYN